MSLKMGFKKGIVLPSLGDTSSKMIINRKPAFHSCTVREFYNEKAARKYLLILTHK